AKSPGTRSGLRARTSRHRPDGRDAARLTRNHRVRAVPISANARLCRPPSRSAAALVAPGPTLHASDKHQASGTLVAALFPVPIIRVFFAVVLAVFYVAGRAFNFRLFRLPGGGLRNPEVI